MPEIEICLVDHLTLVTAAEKLISAANDGIFTQQVKPFILVCISSDVVFSDILSYSIHVSLDRYNVMSILVDLVKLGAIGASLAFLYLAYSLLNAEAAREGNPRPEILSEIRSFRLSALLFLIVGVLSHLMITHGSNMIDAAFGNNLVRLRFQQWSFYPETRLIKFALEENNIDTTLYIPPKTKNLYEIYVGIRRKTDTPKCPSGNNLNPWNHL